MTHFSDITSDVIYVKIITLGLDILDDIVHFVPMYVFPIWYCVPQCIHI